MKVYCGNCKRKREICLNCYGTYYTHVCLYKFRSDCRIRNKNNNCQYYKPKLKQWIKEMIRVYPMNKYFRNQKEILTIASIIFAEVKIEKEPAQTLLNAMAILMVGINRLKNPVRYKCEKNKTSYMLYDIFTAPDQYSCYPNSTQFRKSMDGKLSIQEDKVFGYIFQMLMVLYKCDTSNHYYNPKLCSPNWAQGVPVDFVVGNHNFLTL